MVKIKLYSDGANLAQMIAAQNDERISGLTTNPSLLRAAGVQHYERFAKTALEIVTKPISFEVISDDESEMEMQAHRISSWAENVYVKIPIMNSLGHSSINLIERLSGDGIKLNITAVFTAKQIMNAALVLRGAPAILSIFAGRIADTGVDPVPLFKQARKYCTMNVEILWASTREVFNIKQAEQAGADIITCAPEILRKMAMFDYDLEKYSRDTVKMFFDDAVASGFTL